MLINLKINNCYAFNEEVNLSLKADMRTKKFPSNIFKDSKLNILKSVGIYGGNNTGKTCLVQIMSDIKNIILNRNNRLESNIFNESNLCNIALSFLYGKEIYNYEIKYNSSKNEFLFEKFSEIEMDEYNNSKETNIFFRDFLNNKFDSTDLKLKDSLPLSSKDNILIYSFNVEIFEVLKKAKSILTFFAEKIEIVSMEHIDLIGYKKTVNFLKNNDKNKSSIINFIRNADLYLDDFKYDSNIKIPIKNEEINKTIENIPELSDQFKCISVYKGKEMPSYRFDSLGTKKITALAGYLIEAIKENKILIIDEIDSSIHFKLTRAIVSLFNNELNEKAQIIFTTHDINLMDIKTLFRKEQIWFTHKDDKRTYLYSLADFTAENGVRDTIDIIEKYTKGFFGAIPDPKLIKSLIEIVGND